MNSIGTWQELAKKQDRNLAHSSPGGLVLVLTLCLMAIGGCQPGADPLQKAFDAIGGRDSLLELRGFSSHVHVFWTPSITAR